MKNFLSDNVSGISKEILESLTLANHGLVDSYGDDKETDKLNKNFDILFENKVGSFPVVSGTAANSLAFASCVPPYGAIFTSEESHINEDECNAPEFYTGGAKLINVKSNDAKLCYKDLIKKIDNMSPRGIHNSKPALVSITQSSELGTVYNLDEIRKIAEITHENNMFLHMDGARIANAVVNLDCSFADITWKSGVDILSFGATKNGAFCAEAIIYFNNYLSENIEYYRKRGGHLISKMRFISAQLNSYIETGIWEKNARHANDMASFLSESLKSIKGVKVVYPVQSNAVFVNLSDEVVKRLFNQGFNFSFWGDKSERIYRIMISFNTPRESIIDLVQAIKKESKG